MSGGSARRFAFPGMPLKRKPKMSTSENKKIVRRDWEGRSNEKNLDVVDEFFPDTGIDGQKT
jgi:hypothetical protein